MLYVMTQIKIAFLINKLFSSTKEYVINNAEFSGEKKELCEKIKWRYLFSSNETLDEGLKK